MMKKTFSVVLALVLALTMLLPQTIMAFAADEATIAVSTVEATPGSTVDVTISLENNPGVASVLLDVGYDDTVLTLLPFDLEEGEPMSIDGGILGTYFHSSSYKNPYRLSWANDTLKKNITTNGVIVTLKFVVAEDAEVGTELPITVSYNYDNYDIIDVDMEPVNFAVSNGAIKVVKPVCKHENVTTTEGKAATCTEPGYTASEVCAACGDVLVAQTEIPALGHTEEVVAGKDATCKETGLTEGKKCTVCGEVTEEQKEVPVVAHNYVSAVTAPTCTTAGYTTYTCSVCNDSYTADEKAALGHTEVDVEAVAPTCTATGLTAGKKCSVCGEFTVPQTEVAATGHTEEAVAGKAATCTETGLTDGKKCSVCGAVTVAQEEIPMADHNFVDGVCSVCGAQDVCEHMCHDEGILGFFWKILNFFFQLLNMESEQICACGEAHW